MKYFKTLIGAIALAGVSIGSADNAMRDMNHYSCRDILLASGEERDLAVMFLQGYFVGKSGQSTFDRDKLARATDKMLDLCLDATDGNLVETMAKALQAVQES